MAIGEVLMAIIAEEPLSVLILEDVPADAELVQRALRDGGIHFTARVAATREAFIEALGAAAPDIILADSTLPDFSAREALEHVQQHQIDVPVVVVTGSLDDAHAIELVRAGAKFYVLKDNLIRLPSILKSAVAAARDVRALKAARDELRVSELRYRRLFETAQDGILILDAENGRIIDVNPFLVTLLGFTQDEFHGRQLWQIGLFEDAAHNRATFGELQRTGYMRYDDLPLQTKDGQRINVEFVSNAYCVDGRRVIQCNVRDITARKAAEDRLRTSELRYRRLFEAARDGILILDSASGQIVDANPFMIELLGYTAKEFRGKQLWQIGVFADAAQSRATIAELQRIGYRRHDDLPLQTKDGRRIDVEFVSNVYDVDGQRVIQCNVRDITDRVAAEKKLVEYRDELERTVAARTAQLAASNGQLKTINDELQSFAYAVSHDLRAPLRAISGFAHILAEDHAGKLDDEGRHILDVLRDNAAKMEQLIGGILEFSRIGRAELTITPVDMTALVKNTLAEDLAQATAGRALAIDIGQLPQIRGDLAMLRRVWLNLLDNAIKFTAAKSDARIQVGAAVTPGETIFFVRDTGIGFDMAYADKLFNAFQRLHGAEIAGTGIGLAIVKRIVARHGGRAWAEGRVGEGATFYFSLPTTEAGSA